MQTRRQMQAFLQNGDFQFAFRRSAWYIKESQFLFQLLVRLPFKSQWIFFFNRSACCFAKTQSRKGQRRGVLQSD